MSTEDIQVEDTAKRRTAKAARDLLANDWKNQVSTPAGRRFVWRLLCDAKVFQSTFSSADGGLVHAFNEGTRNQGLAILTNLNTYAPGAFSQMMAEAQGAAK